MNDAGSEEVLLGIAVFNVENKMVVVGSRGRAIAAIPEIRLHGVFERGVVFVESCIEIKSIGGNCLPNWMVVRRVGIKNADKTGRRGE